MKRLRLLRRRIAERYAWPDLVVVGREIPDVGECHVHRDGGSCAQCDGSHAHLWRRCVVLAKGGGFIGSATRCEVCGGRKCDVPACKERRHHLSPHMAHNGTVLGRVGG